MIAWLDRWAERVLHAVAVAGVAILSLAIALTLADIAARAVVGVSITGMIDITQLCVMAMAFWSIPYAFARDGHVRITFATERLPARAQAALDAAAAAAGFGVVALIGWYGHEQALTALRYGDSSQTIGIPMIWYWAFLLSGCALSLVATAIAVLGHLATALGPAPAGSR